MSIEGELEKELKQKIEEQNFISLEDVPRDIEVKIISVEFKEDSRGNKALFLSLATKEKKTIVQKYTATTFKHLRESLKACGGSEALKKEFAMWTKERVGRTVFERLYPKTTA